MTADYSEHKSKLSAVKRRQGGNLVVVRGLLQFALPPLENEIARALFIITSLAPPLKNK